MNYFQDEDGNILELEEVGSQDIIDSELVIEEVDVDFDPSSKLQFVDERKELVRESNTFMRILSRCGLAVWIFALAAAWLMDYSKSRYFYRRSSFVWVSVFFAAQLFSCLVLQPLLLLLHASAFSCGLYRCLCCRSEKCLSRTMPLSLMLYVDLKEQSELLHQIRKEKK